MRPNVEAVLGAYVLTPETLPTASFGAAIKLGVATPPIKHVATKLLKILSIFILLPLARPPQ
jgi:hypothetical protein